MKQKIIGVMGAMPEEIMGVVALLEDVREYSLARRTYYKGKLNGISAVVVVSGWGKVAAATTISTLILKFDIDELIFTGVAGAISPDLKIGDIVFAQQLVQHDMDARPFIPQFEIPQLGIAFLEAPEVQAQKAIQAIKTLLDDKHLHAVIHENDLRRFGIVTPRLLTGLVASGDKFFSSNSDKLALSEKLPDILCVEMEGAAVAQVCNENAIPFSIIRTISDTSDDNSVLDFPAFIKDIASKYSIAIVRNIFAQMGA